MQSSTSSSTVQEVIQRVAEVAQFVGGERFNDVQEGEIHQLVLSDSEDLSPEEIETLLEQPQEEETSPSETELAVATLTAQTVSKICSFIQEATEIAFAYDSVMTRSLQFQQGCEQLTFVYEELHRDLVHRMTQAKVTNFFQPLPKP